MMLKRIRGLFSRRARKARPGAAPPDRSRAEVPVHRGASIVHQPIPRSDLDPEAVKIVLRLTRFDHQAYLVGGCVRDLLLDRQPKDFDVGTSATPRQVRRLFRNCRIIGRRFRLAHIYFQDGKIIEVATFRGKNGSGTVPAANEAAPAVLIVDDNQFGTVEEDALRRDFTINSLFYDINRETVLDHTDGLGDLRRRLVRTIGDARVRFREDPIRILRAIKFAARLGFTIESTTLQGLKETRKEIPKAASARILEEINRFCRGGAARRSFELLREMEVFPVILAELADAYSDRSWDLLFALLERIDQRLADGEEAGTSEILTVLVLPAIVEQLGWSWKGTAGQPRGMDVRTVVDSVLRPLSLRLRCPRRDQEVFRSTAMTLFRMVPTDRLARNGKRVILGRETFPLALRMLDVLAGQLGGEFEEARLFWRQAARPIDGERAVEAEPRRDGPRRRRGRRGGRRRSGHGAERSRSDEGGRSEDSPRGAEHDPTAERGRKVARGRPAERNSPPRAADDGDFFSKLPTAPKVAGDDGRGDRYGAGSLSVEVDPTPHPGDGAEAAAGEAGDDATTTESRPRPRRRRRRRRRPSSGEGGAESSE